jgi:transposase
MPQTSLLGGKVMGRQRSAGDGDARLPLVNLNAAGLDIGASEIWACVPADRDAQTVRQFGTFTPDLHDLGEWLVGCGIETVAMESTGVYWIPAYEILEARGLRVYLVNARHIKNVPGRKSDVQDCQWMILYKFVPLQLNR